MSKDKPQREKQFPAPSSTKPKAEGVLDLDNLDVTKEGRQGNAIVRKGASATFVTAASAERTAKE